MKMAISLKEALENHKEKLGDGITFELLDEPLSDDYPHCAVVRMKSGKIPYEYFDLCVKDSIEDLYVIDNDFCVNFIKVWIA